MEMLQAQYVALKMKARDTIFVTICLIWDKQRFQQALVLAQEDPTQDNARAFMNGDFMTTYSNYPLDPVQYALVQGEQALEGKRNLGRLLYEEFVTQFKELSQGNHPAGFAIMHCNEEDHDFFEIMAISDEILPLKVSDHGH